MKSYTQIITILAVFVLFNGSVSAEKLDNFDIYEGQSAPSQISFKFPDWFKTSFYDLPEDLNDARESGKRGIIVVFSQKNCNHCLAFMKATLEDPEVKKRVLKNYDVIGMDIFNDLEVTDIDGSVTPIKDFSTKHRAYLTPTVMFYGIDNERMTKIVGFYPPEKFHKVLDYIDGGHYKKTKLSKYLRGSNTTNRNKTTLKSSLNDDPIFLKSSYNLAAIREKSKRPTLVLFERPNCNPCKRFHERVMTVDKVRKTMGAFNVVQLDATDNKTIVTTPDGTRTTANQWFEKLDLSYDIVSVFFDENGKEVFRSDAETGKFRMIGHMEYVLAKGYEDVKQVQRWRRQQILNNIAQQKR